MRRTFGIIIIILLATIGIISIKKDLSERAMEKANQNQNIVQITIQESEEEGGFSKSTLYPAGYLYFEGQPGSGGYQPLLKNGWYKIENQSYLQEIFDSIRSANRTQEPIQTTPGTTATLTISSNTTFHVSTPALATMSILDLISIPQAASTPGGLPKQSIAEPLPEVPDINQASIINN